MRKAILVFSCLLFVVSPSLFSGGEVKWDVNGAPICLGSRSGGVAATSDGERGAIIMWIDDRDVSGNIENIYAQRIDFDGNTLWENNGVQVSMNSYPPGYWMEDLAVTSDGMGGAISVWDGLSGDGSAGIYAQRIDSTGTILWDSIGVPICIGTPDTAQDYPNIVSDGASGAIIAWEDYRNGIENPRDIYVQRVDSSGAVRWDVNGIFIATEVCPNNYPWITSNCVNGAIINWSDYSNRDIYTQGIDSSGMVMWDTSGVPVCTTEGTQGGGVVVSDNEGGEVIFWGDRRGGDWDIYAQKIDSNGEAVWTINGAPICLAESLQVSPKLVNDGTGCVIVCWVDYRSGNKDIYAQKVNSNGDGQWDVNGVFISAAVDTTAGLYTVPSIVSDEKGGAIVVWNDYRNGNWDIYAQRIDSSGVVQWGTDDIAVCTTSTVQSCISIVTDGDNGAIIAWADTKDGWSVYAQRVGDAEESVEETKSVGCKMQNAKLHIYPNPFSTSTHIVFSILHLEKVKLLVYDSAGRIVRTLVQGKKKPGHYSIEWNGRDEKNKKLPSGVYFYRLETGDFTSTKKVLLIR